MCQALCWPWVIAGNKGPVAGRCQKEGRVAWVSAMDTAGPCLHGPRLPGYSGSYVSIHNGALSLRTPPRAAFPGLPLYRCDVAWVWPHQLLFLPPVRSLLREPVPPCVLGASERSDPTEGAGMGERMQGPPDGVL